ncbi:hypothetical protein V6B08_09230 [Ferrovibrio sp. MS7]|uniref:hypothetical protein n=1 Tax=Ferrovibrio plantarum TaxID=3119164 RepID=UPI003134B741
MYNDDILRIPANEDEMWKVLREQYVFVRHLLYELPVETKEQALDVDLQSTPTAELARISMGSVRYRNVSEENDQRDYYLEIGRGLLPYIERALDERKLTPEFVQQWGKVMFCHGYIASHVFDDSDDLETYRNRAKGARASDRTPQRVFLARLLLWFMNEQKQTRQQAEASAAKAIWKFIDAKNSRQVLPNYDLDWFRTLVREGEYRDRIVTTMAQKNLNKAELNALAVVEFEGVPSIEVFLSVVRS